MIYSVYLITNIINNERYVGITKKTIHERWTKHKSHAREFGAGKRKKGCTRLYNAIVHYGVDNFKIEKIAEAATRAELNQLEKDYIIQYNTRSPNGYNLTSGGDSFDHSEETKQKIRERTGDGISKHITSYRKHNDILNDMPKRFIYLKASEKLCEGIALHKHPLCERKGFYLSQYKDWDELKNNARKFLIELEAKGVPYIPPTGRSKKQKDKSADKCSTTK